MPRFHSLATTLKYKQPCRQAVWPAKDSSSVVVSGFAPVCNNAKTVKVAKQVQLVIQALLHTGDFLRYKKYKVRIHIYISTK